MAAVIVTITLVTNQENKGQLWTGMRFHSYFNKGLHQPDDA